MIDVWERVVIEPFEDFALREKALTIAGIGINDLFKSKNTIWLLAIFGEIDGPKSPFAQKSLDAIVVPIRIFDGYPYREDHLIYKHRPPRALSTLFSL